MFKNPAAALATPDRTPQRRLIDFLRRWLRAQREVPQGLMGPLRVVVRQVLPHAPTQAPYSDEAIQKVLIAISSLPMDDAVVFDISSLRLTQIQEDARAVGHRAIMDANLGRGRLLFRADIGFNDVVTPAPEILSMETILSGPVTILERPESH